MQIDKCLVSNPLRWLVGRMLGGGIWIAATAVAFSDNYQDTVIGLGPTFYYELNETDTEGGAVDTMGNAPAPGEFNGDYEFGAPVVGGPGPTEVFGGIAVPGVGGVRNLAHYSNDQGHITLGNGTLFGSSAMTVALFFKAGPADGGDRLFTNNLNNPLTSFQINIGNNGLVLAVDPTSMGAPAERTLYMEDNSEPDRRLRDVKSGWFHVIASTHGTTGAERAANFTLWINGVDRTENLQPDSTGWQTDTGMAKIGGRRANGGDSTTHSGAQDEVAIWLDRVLTEAEMREIWESAITEKKVPLVFTDIELGEDPKTAQPTVTVTWQSRPQREYIIFSSTDLTEWTELNDSHQSQGDLTSYTDTELSAGTTRVYYRVVEAAP